MKRAVSLFLLSLFFYFLIPLYAADLDEIIIEGWSLEKIVKGKKVYSIEADRATFGNKLIGFFELGIVKVLNLDNVYLTWYNNGDIVKKQHFNKLVYELNLNRCFDESGNPVFIEAVENGFLFTFLRH